MPMRFNRVGIIFQKGYDMKCQRMKKYFYIGLSAFMSLYLSLCSCIGSYASTDSGASNTMSASNWLQRYWDAGSRWICDKYVVGSDAIYGTFADFLSWSVNEYGSEWMDDKEVTIIQNLGEQEQYIVPDDVQEVVQEYVQYNITQNPLGYTECYIRSYNFLSPSLFSSYGQYASVKEHIRSNNAPCAINSYTNVNGRWMYLTKLDSSRQISYVGTTLSGLFSNVHAYYDWSIVSNNPKYQINGNGTLTSYGSASLQTYTLLNTTLGTDNGDNWTIFSNQAKDELVYVFRNLNALKNYNSGLPQPYYLTSEGLASNDWSANSGICNSGTMNNSGNYYSTVTNGVGANWTPDQILALVDKVTSANGGSGGSSNSDNNSSLWEKLGDTLGNLVDGIINVFVSLIQHLSDGLLTVLHLLFGYTDDNGVNHAGLFDNLLALISGNLTGFLGTVFDFLPSEIVTCFTTVIVLSVLFAIFRFMRR